MSKEGRIVSIIFTCLFIVLGIVIYDDVTNHLYIDKVCVIKDVLYKDGIALYTCDNGETKQRGMGLRKGEKFEYTIKTHPNKIK